MRLLPVLCLMSVPPPGCLVAPWQVRKGIVKTMDGDTLWLRGKAEDTSTLNGAQIDNMTEIEVLEEVTSSLGTLFYLIKEGKRKKGYVRASNVQLLV